MTNHSLKRPTVPAMDGILGTPFGVHDEGFVRLIDYMGNDASIVQAARVSYGQGTRTVKEDSALIDYLMRHSHTSPFEMCEIKLHIKAPIFIARQWMRHRTASVNEVSGRYSVMDCGFYTPSSREVSAQSTSNKQGSGEALPFEHGVAFGIGAKEVFKHAMAFYLDCINQGVSREQSRIVLPLSTYTEFYWKIDLHNLLHFLYLRTHPHAQKEIRDYAQVIEVLVQTWCPAVYAAWVKHRKDSVTFSSYEMQVLRRHILPSVEDDMGLFSNRERDEFRNKVNPDKN